MQTGRLYLISTLAGILSFLVLIAVYLGIVSLVSGSLSHALELFSEDKWLVTAIATGFGTQVGLFAFLRLALHAAARGAGMLTGAGTGASTVSMIACCVHHVADVAPILGLAGITTIASFLTENKIPLMLIGLVMNLIGIIVTLRVIQKTKFSLEAQ